MSTKRGRPASATDGAKEAVSLVRNVQNVLHLSDEALGQAAGVHQSSVSRALGREPPTFTPSLRKLCNYAEIAAVRLEETTDFQAAARFRLSESVADVWDGTPAGLNGLLAVLKALGQLRRDQ